MKTLREQIHTGDIVLVPFPFIERLDGVTKVRPVLILLVNPERDYIVIAFITSSLQNFDPHYDVRISLHSRDFILTGLTKNSLVRLDKIQIVVSDQVFECIGQCSSELFSKIKNKMRIVYGL